MNTMTEPASTAAGGIALYKLGLLAAIGSLLVSLVVMLMTLPKTGREFATALISTVVSSICGGAGVVRWFELSSWAHDDLGLIALLGLAFVCGLPAWIVVRALFNWSEARKTEGLPELVHELREMRADLTRQDEQ